MQVYIILQNYSEIIQIKLISLMGRVSFD